jgi:predicted ArsR family transcriptional regulator
MGRQPADRAAQASVHAQRKGDCDAGAEANKAIARRLDISPNTVKTHVARIYQKLAVASRTQAVQKARTLDILP